MVWEVLMKKPLIIKFPKSEKINEQMEIARRESLVMYAS